MNLPTKVGSCSVIRRAKSVHLTEIGKAYLPSVKDALEGLSLSTNGLFGPDLKNTIVVRVSIAAIVWLTPKLGSFRKEYPNVGIKFVTSIWADVADTKTVDLDIILAPENQLAPYSEKLSDERIVPICGLNTAAKVKSVTDLRHVNSIHILGFDDHWARYMAAFDHEYDVDASRLIVDTSVAACEMVASDLGCAVIIERFAKNAIQTGRPVTLVGNPVPLGQSHYLVDKKASTESLPEKEAFKEWLRKEFAAP